jgi:hypothetical protein
VLKECSRAIFFLQSLPEKISKLCQHNFTAKQCILPLNLVPFSPRHSFGKPSRIQQRTLLNKLDSVIECISNGGASFYTQREQRKQKAA